MPYYVSPFGSADGSNAEGTVHNQFGPRTVGSVEGVFPAKGVLTEAAVNFDGEDFPFRAVLPVNSYVTKVYTVGYEGTVSTLTVGGTDVSGATDTAPVGPVSGELVAEGPTSGTVTIEYFHIAGSQDDPEPEPDDPEPDPDE